MQRYGFDSTEELVASDIGDWVRYEDAQAELQKLQSELDSKIAELDAANIKVGELLAERDLDAKTISDLRESLQSVTEHANASAKTVADQAMQINSMRANARTIKNAVEGLLMQ